MENVEHLLVSECWVQVDVCGPVDGIMEIDSSHVNGIMKADSPSCQVSLFFRLSRIEFLIDMSSFFKNN